MPGIPLQKPCWHSLGIYLGTLLAQQFPLEAIHIRCSQAAWAINEDAPYSLPSSSVGRMIGGNRGQSRQLYPQPKNPNPSRLLTMTQVPGLKVSVDALPTIKNWDKRSKDGNSTRPG